MTSQFYHVMKNYNHMSIKDRVRLYFFLRAIRTGQIKVIEIDT